MTEPGTRRPSNSSAASGEEAELGRLADTAQRELATPQLSRPLRRSAGSLLLRVRRSHSYAEARTVTEEAAQQAARYAEILVRLDTELARLQQKRPAAEPFGSAWKDAVTDEISNAASGRTQLWMRRYAEAFVAGRFDITLWLSGGSPGEDGGGPLLEDRNLSRRMLLSARAARADNLAATLPALETLTESEYAASLPQELRLRAWCMRVRAVARGVGDAALARDMAEAALAQARGVRPAVPAEVLAALHAAHGECLLETGDLDGAARAADQALRRGRDEPAGHVLRGLIAEAVEDFTAADESYEEAAEVGGARAIAGTLFAPVPPNLLWQHGRRLRGTDPRGAARVLRRALLAGIRGTGAYPDRKAYVDLANALDRQLETASGALRDRLVADAAEVYWEAGRRYAWIGDEISAIDFLSRASTLDPTSPRYAYECAEALRIRAVREDGTVDLGLLRRASEGWQRAYALGVPGTEIPWAYVTRALIAHEESGDLYRPQASWLAVAVLERGLLCDPRNVRTMAQLSQAHRLLGHRLTAFALIEAANELDPGDELVFDQRMLAMLEVERPAEALDVIEDHGLRPDQPWLVVRKVQILLMLGRPAEGLALLQAVRPLDQALNDLYLGLCHELLGDDAAARKSYEAVAGGSGSAGPDGRSDLSAWACYLLGQYDDAEHAYEPLVREHRDDPSLQRDLGQILLARGDDARDDVNAGHRLVISGIRATSSLWSLSSLERIDLQRLLRRIGANPPQHVAAALADVRAALQERERELRSAQDATAELEAIVAEGPRTGAPEAWQGACLALARIALEREAVEEAMERYVDLAPEVPEATRGLGAAGDRLRRSADQQAESKEFGRALATYGRLLALVERSPEPLFELASASHLRAALVALQLRKTDEFNRHAVQAFPENFRVEETGGVQDALAGVFEQPRQYWQVMDAARRLGGGPDRPSGAEVASANRLLTALDPSALLRAGRSDVSAASVFPLATPLEIRLGPGLLSDRRRAGPALRGLVDQVRRRIEKETGVVVPGVGLQRLPDGAEPGAYVIELYEVPKASGAVLPDGRFVPDDVAAGPMGSPAAPTAPSTEDPLSRRSGRWVTEAGGAADPDGSCTADQFVVRHLEAVLRTHLPRLFDIDDVGIWLTSVSGGPDAIHALDRLSTADRLEILRLLRLLLREQVPITEAETILRVVHEAGPEWSAVDLLPAVRAHLRSQLAPAAVRSALPALLPEELEAAFAAGCSADGDASWQLPRPAAVDLAERVVAWRRAQSQDSPVLVRDPMLRPYFWRLLAVLVPGPVWVLSQEEIDGLD